MLEIAKHFEKVLARFQMSPDAYKFDSFVRSWKRTNPINWNRVGVPFESGLVSIILPSYNGERLISEAIDSLLAQTYQPIEIIAINDGSSDRTGEILASYAAKDARVKVYIQQNQKIPKTLSRGFKLARGEFLTWTSVDNRLKRNCIEMLVGSMRRNPRWDMVYANIDLIDDDGNPLTDSDWYTANQRPSGSEHIHLPRYTAELNTWANNHIGAAFLYRARVAWAIGDYSASRFLIEDYDYWMKVNELMTLRHADFNDCIYDYRFHRDSLTSKDKELGITAKKKKLVGLDDFRRSFYLSKSVWIVTDDGTAAGQDKRQSIKKELEQRKAIVLEAEFAETLTLPLRWMPIVQLHCANTVHTPPQTRHKTACRVYLCSQQGPVSNIDCDLFVTNDSIASPDLLHLEDGYRGWWSIPELSDLITLCEVQAKNKQLTEIERQAVPIEPPLPKKARQLLSVVVCTYQRSARLANCLRSLMSQTLTAETFEIVLVNNDPHDSAPKRIIEQIQAECTDPIAPQITLIDCPLSGLSYARNAGLSECRGDFVVFIDDDAMAMPDCLQHRATACANTPSAGVIGGHTRLKVPEPRPEVLAPGREEFWSQYLTDYKVCTEVENWREFPVGALWGARRQALFEMGGFRYDFGRVANGEEVVAALLARNLGYSVWIEPRAEVQHDVETCRYTPQHVERTIESELMMDYQLQTELYLPLETTLASVAHDSISSARTRMALWFRGLLRKDKLTSVETLYARSYAKGRALVAKQKALDVIRRFFKPEVHK